LAENCRPSRNLLVKPDNLEVLSTLNDRVSNGCGFSARTGGKRYSGRTTKGNKPLSGAMVQGAWSASRTKGTFFKARYHRLAARRGKKRAIVAVAHSMLVSAWHMLTFQQPYQELGSDYFDERKKESKVSYLVRRLEKLTGSSVSIELQPAAA